MYSFFYDLTFTGSEQACSTIVKYLVLTNGKCRDIPKTCPRKRSYSICRSRLGGAKGNITINVKNVGNIIGSKFSVMFDSKGCAFYTVNGRRLVLLGRLSPIIPPVFSWLGGFSTEINGYAASTGDIEASVSFTFSTGEILVADIRLSPSTVDGENVIYECKVHIRGAFPTSYSTDPQDPAVYGFMLEESIAGVINGLGRVELTTNETVQLEISINYTSNSNLPIFDNVVIDATHTNLTRRRSMSDLTFTTKSKLNFPSVYNLFGNISMASDPSVGIEYFGKIPTVTNSTTRIASVPNSRGSLFLESLIPTVSIPTIVSTQHRDIGIGINSFSGIVNIGGINPVFVDGRVDKNGTTLEATIQINTSVLNNVTRGSRNSIEIILLPSSPDVVFTVVLPTESPDVVSSTSSVFKVTSRNNSVPENGVIISGYTHSIIPEKILEIFTTTTSEEGKNHLYVIPNAVVCICVNVWYSTISVWISINYVHIAISQMEKESVEQLQVNKVSIIGVLCQVQLYVSVLK